jgi:hypothetical protein
MLLGDIVPTIRQHWLLPVASLSGCASTPATPGAVHQPTETGQGIITACARIQAENEAREKATQD